MFNYTDIITNGSDLVAWRQPSSTILSDHFLTGQSGLYVNDLRGITIEKIEDSLNDDYTDINDYLQKVQESEIQNLIYDFAANSKSQLGSRELLSNFDVTNGVTDYTNLATKNARFVGWVIKPSKSNNIKTEITKIGLQLSEAQTLRIYLYETSQQDAIATFDFDYTSPLSLQWASVDEFVANYRGDYGTNQQYLLGYYETDPSVVRTSPLTGEAVRYEFDCGCNDSPKRIYGRYAQVQPVIIESGSLNGVKLPDMRDITSYYNDYSLGIFAKLNVTCDITDVLVDNMLIFAKAYQYKIAVRVLEDYLTSDKLNPTTDAKRQRETSEYARNMYWNFLNGWKDGDDRYHRGLMDDLSIDFSQIDNVCLPCEEARPKVGHITYRV